MLSGEVTSVDSYGNPLLHPVIHSHLGKDHHSPHPPRPRQIYTQIHFQIASLLTDTMFTLFTIRAEKILRTKPWKAWVEMSPVGSVVWLARKQLIPNVDSISFSLFDSTAARSMAVAECLLSKQINERGKKFLLERDRARRAKTHIWGTEGKPKPVDSPGLHVWNSLNIHAGQDHTLYISVEHTVQEEASKQAISV